MKLGQRIGVPVFELGTDAKPDEIAAQGVAKAKKVQSLIPASCPLAGRFGHWRAELLGDN